MNLNQSFAMSHWLQVDTRTKRIPDSSNNEPRAETIFVEKAFLMGYVRRGLLSEGVLRFKMALAS